MSLDPLTVAQLQILFEGIVIALVGWYFLHREKKGTNPGKETSDTKASPTR